MNLLECRREDNPGIEEVVVVLLVTRALAVNGDVEARTAGERLLQSNFHHVLPLGPNWHVCTTERIADALRREPAGGLGTREQQVFVRRRLVVPVIGSAEHSFPAWQRPRNADPRLPLPSG